MIFETSTNAENKLLACQKIFDAWKVKKKVFILRSKKYIKNVKSFYNRLLPHLGEPQTLAKNATIATRDAQRTHTILIRPKYPERLPALFCCSTATYGR
jgi:hypothetical protein